MRILCDHCSLLITGTVKRLAGNFNFHPDCLTELGEEAEMVQLPRQGSGRESSIGALLEWSPTEHSTQDGMVSC